MTTDGDGTGRAAPGAAPSSGAPVRPTAGTPADGPLAASRPEGPDDVAAWRARRTEAAAHQAAELDRRRAQESAEAGALLREFVEQARQRGIAPVPLQARSYGGDATYRTRTSGWYLRKNRTVAVGTDGAFYVLSVPGGLSARIRGADLTPSDPPLVLGKGGRDGESISLADALALVLERG